jgi:thiaminase
MASTRETWSLTEHLLATHQDLYKSATQHPFLLAGAEGRLPKDILSRWLASDRLYIHSYIRAAGKLLATIDLPQQIFRSQEAFETQLADWLIEALVAIRKEERFFIDVADRYDLGIDFAIPLPPASQTAASSQKAAETATTASKDGAPPGLAMMESIFASVGSPSASSPVSESNVPGLSLVKSFLTTTAGPSPPAVLPWLEGALIFWGTERCYLDAWSWAREKAQNRGQFSSSHPEDADGGALRKEFIPNWSSPEFARFVDKLGGLIDAAVAGVMAGKEGDEKDTAKAEILGRVEGKWKSLLEAERQFWPDVKGSD